MRRLLTAAVALAALWGSPFARAEGPAITERIDAARLVTLAGNTRPEALDPSADRGPLADEAPMEHMLLALKRPAARDAAFARLVDELADPASPNYHRWLTAAEIGERFGPDAADVAAVTAWLRQSGFRVDGVYPSLSHIDFSGTAATVRQAFHVDLRRIEAADGMHFANAGDPQIPAALAPVVAGPLSLSDFHPHAAAHGGPAYSIANCSVGQADAAHACHLVTPADLATIYAFNPVFNGGITGKGETIAVVEDSNIWAASDWTRFRSLFGLARFTTGSLIQTHPAPPTGTNNCANPGTNGDDFEATIDAAYASAAAPNARIEVASCTSTTTWGIALAAFNLVNAKTPPPVISMSYIDCEAAMGASASASISSLAQQAAAEGISFFVSAGDEGAAACDYGASKATQGLTVNGLASNPYAVAVGGTDFADTYLGESATYWNPGNTAAWGSAKSYIPEIPWNNSCASTLLAKFVTGSAVTYNAAGFCATNSAYVTTLAGGGGVSKCGTRTGKGACAPWPKPSWQQVYGNPADKARDIPDVSLFAAGIPWGNAYVVCLSDPSHDYGSPCSEFPSRWIYGYGTSFAAPIMAGIQALIDQAMAAPQGNPNPVLYKIARAEFGATGNANCNSTLGSKVGAACVFHDVTQGDIDVPCVLGTSNCFGSTGGVGVLSGGKAAYAPTYRAVKGWDFATGLGSVNVNQLLAAWKKQAP